MKNRIVKLAVILIISGLNLPGGASFAAEFEVLDRLSVDGYTVLRGSADISGGSFTVGGSTFVIKDGKVGIGTTAPGGKLQVDDASSAAAYPILVNNPVSGTNIAGAGIKFAAHGRAFASILGGQQADGSFANGTLGFYTELNDALPGSPQMFIQGNSGNIGIGTTNPALYTAGFTESLASPKILSIQGANSGAAIVMGDRNNKQGQITLENGAMSFAVGGNYYTNNNFIFALNDGASLAEKVRIQYNGNVGIGTASPLQKLNIHGASGAPATSGTTQNGLFALSTDNAYGTLYAGALTASPYSLWLQASGRNDLSANYPVSIQPNGGNVGIGTTNPGVKLDVAGGIKATGLQLSDSLNIITPQNTRTALYMLQTQVGEAGFGMLSADNTLYITNQTGSQALGYAPQSIVIKSNGNVGIGTVSPSAKLQVIDASALVTWPLIVSNNYGPNAPADLSQVGILFTANPSAIAFAGITGGQQNANTYAQGRLDFWTRLDDSSGPTVKMSILQNGNVGIGTTSPGKKLDVAGEVRSTVGGVEFYMVPKGGIIMWSGSPASIPTGWALCDGTNGTPNLSGRFIVGYNSGDSDYSAIGNIGGEKTHTLAASEIPSHYHVDGYAGVNPTSTYGVATVGAIGNVNTQNGTSVSNHALTSSTGGGGAHENRPPYYVLAYIMRI